MGHVSGNPPTPLAADIVGADDIITNLAKEREPRMDIIKHIP